MSHTIIRRNSRVEEFQVDENVWGLYDLDKGGYLFLDVFDHAVFSMAESLKSRDELERICCEIINQGTNGQLQINPHERIKRLVTFGALIEEGLNRDVEVLLVDPPAVGEQHVGTAGPAMSLCYLSSALVQNDMPRANILDLRSVSRTIGYDLPIHGEYFTRFAVQYPPKLVGITAVSASIERALYLARLTKALFPECFVVLGGQHAAYEWASLLSLGCVDAVVRGEGEVSFPALVRRVLDKSNKKLEFSDISGIAWQTDNGPVTSGWSPVVEDLDSIRVPDMHDGLINRADVPIQYGRIMSSRGCPFTCSFCSTATFTGRRVRYRSIPSVVNEIRYYYERYNIKGFSFNDDIFTINKKRTLELCRAIRNLPFSSELEFSCNTRLDCIDEEVLEELHLTGLNGILFGVESGDIDVHTRFAKGKRGLQGFQQKIEFMLERGMNPDLNFILGLPGESTESISKIITLIKNFPEVPCAFNFLNVFPGTPLEAKAEELGLVILGQTNQARYSLFAPTVSTATMSAAQQIESFLRLQWARNQLSVARKHGKGAPTACEAVGPCA